MEILANHAHVFPKAFREDGTVDVLLSTMEKTGISTAVCFAPFFEYGACSDSNRWLNEALRSHPELTGFGVINMADENVEDQVKEIAELGFRGIKMHPQFQKFCVDEEKAKRVYQTAQDLGLFISFHTGTHWYRLKDSQLLLFDEISYFFPDLKFSIEHVGGYCFFEDAIAVLLNNENVYAGLTSVFDNAMNKFWYLSPDKIRDLLHLVGPKRCIFGLDFPYNQTDKIAEAIQCVMELSISDHDKEAILGGNLRSLIGDI